jgi:hypothetical protein
MTTGEEEERIIPILQMSNTTNISIGEKEQEK